MFYGIGSYQAMKVQINKAIGGKVIRTLLTAAVPLNLGRGTFSSTAVCPRFEKD
jgi:hypothetical protein